MKQILLTYLLLTTSVASAEETIQQAIKRINQIQAETTPGIKGMVNNTDLGIGGETVQSHIVNTLAKPDGTFLADRISARAAELVKDWPLGNGVIIHVNQSGREQRGKAVRCGVNSRIPGKHRIWLEGDEKHIFDNLPILLHHVYGVEIPQAERVD